MDFSDLPQSSRDLIEAAELAAQSAFDAFQRDKDSLITQAEEMGTSLSTIVFAPGNIALKVAAAKDNQGRQAAADHLFRVTNGEYWKLLRPDVEAFMSNTTDVWRWAYQKFQVNGGIPATVKRDWRIWALQERATAGLIPRPPLSSAVPGEIPAIQGVAGGAIMIGSDIAVWRGIRGDFEGMPAVEWSLLWSSRPPVWFVAPVQLRSQWTWFHPADGSLRARANAIFLKAAKARGYNSEDEWLDELRYTDFVGFQLSAASTDSLPDRTFVETESGILKDAVAHSITLCHQLEAGPVPKPIIGRLAKDAIARIDSASSSFLADFKIAAQNADDSDHAGNVRLLRELLLRHFNLAGRECMPIFASVGDFSNELRGVIAQFVKCNVSWLGLLGSRLRYELNVGFTLFIMGANPYAGIPETDGPYRVGAIIAEALSDAALNLVDEARARAANKQPASDLAEVTSIAVATSSFPNRAAWLKAKLAEREWNKHNLQRHGGPEHRTTQKILDGFTVQEDILRKVSGGLSSKITHKGRTLPPVAEADIPKS